MITIPGTLSVETCHVTHAKKGLLKTSIGRFNVKCDQLEQLEDGQYKGHFEVTQLDIVPNKHRNAVYFELEASVSNIALQLVEKTAEELKAKRLKKSSMEVEQNDSTQKNLFEEETDDNATEDDIVVEINNADSSLEEQELFGSIWPLGQRVQLDSTVSRDKLHLQMTSLRQLGYLPNREDQCWYKAV